MNKIRTYEGVVAREKQLENELVFKRDLIRNDIEQLKEEWRPVANLITGLSGFSSKVRTHPLLSIGLGLAAGVLEKNIMVAGGGWIARLILPVLEKGIAGGGSSFFSKLIKRFRG